MKRDLLVIVAFVAGGVGGTAVGCAVGFFGLYGICYMISWLAGKKEYMLLMWVGMLIVPLLGLMGLVGGGFLAAMWAGGRIERPQPRGFDVNHTGSDNAGAGAAPRRLGD
jgi:hypothetical protein